jgi:hypothetical protein
MITESEIRERFTAKRSETLQRIVIVEGKIRKLQSTVYADAKDEAAKGVQIQRLEEKLVQLRVNVSDCDAKISSAAVIAERRSLPHDFKWKGSGGQVIAPKGIQSAEKVKGI